MTLEWYSSFDGKHLTWYLAQSPIVWPNLAKLEQRLGKWSLEVWRPSEGVENAWEFVARFDDLEEAKRVGFTIVRLET